MHLKQYILLFGLLGIMFLGLWLRARNNDSIAAKGEQLERLPAEISFNFHVKPILSDKCFACHGPDANKRKAGLRLDVEEDAKAELAENPGKFALSSGSVENSELFHRIFSEDPAIMMPPPDSHLKLNLEEKEILKKWISQGAKYERTVSLLLW